MSQNLLIAPSSNHPSFHTSTSISFPSAPSAPGLPDPLRARHAAPNTSLTGALSEPSSANKQSVGASSSQIQLQSTHPLESRLRNWNATRARLNATLLRRQYGVAAPVHRAMELKDCYEGDALIRLGGARGFGASGSVHGDVLAGTDWEIGGWEGVFGDDGLDGGLDGMRDFHSEMEGIMNL